MHLEYLRLAEDMTSALTDALKQTVDIERKLTQTMLTLNNIAEPVFSTLAPRLNANLGGDVISLHKFRTGGGTII